MADGVLSDIAELDEALAAMDETGEHHPKAEEADDDMSAIDARMQLVNVAMSKLGTRYRRGGSTGSLRKRPSGGGPSGFAPKTK